MLLSSCGVVNAVTGTKKYTQQSPSMGATIPVGSTVTADVVDPGDYRPTRGDIVVFQPPASWEIPAHVPFLKRVVAIGGDTVQCCDKQHRLLLDGKPAGEPYVEATADNPPFDKVTLGPDEIFILGDARAESGDSAEHGPVGSDTVIGVVRTD
ncbi:signal peptidase I [Actinoplanes sp. N902-109]|nr:signal peptidase I [Actinoplanes sp. N902-109]